MDFFNTVAGREFCQSLMQSLSEIAQSLEVVTEQIISNQDKDGSNEK